VIAAAASANHPRGASATRLGDEVVGVVAAGVISNSPFAFFFAELRRVIAAAAAANHPRGAGATRLSANRLGAEVVLAMVAGVKRGSCT
jgi:hypothetical protein